MVDSDSKVVSTIDEAATKKKYVLMFGYCGTAYHGSQTNKNTDTIDDALIDGLHKACVISDSNYYDEKRFIKNGWNRAARTDKGVHAAGNVINCKLEVVQGKEEETVERINSCLPSDIRVFKILRCTKNFNAKNFCDRRQYEYLLPVYALVPFDASSPPRSVVEDVQLHWEEFVENEAYLEKCRENPSLSPENPFEDRPGNRQRVKSLQTAQRLIAESPSFAVYSENAQDVALGGCVGRSEWPEYLSVGLTRLRACMSLFVGTHNFHNYTVGKTSVDASAQRHILGVSVSDPIRIHDDLYLRICLEGQSFMLHQIRKMIGIAIEVARGRCTLHTVNSSLSRGNMVTPMAPSTGLFLSKPVFAEYNKKQTDKARRIDFEDESIRAVRCEFERTQIYEHIDDQIKAEHVFTAWLSSNDSFEKEYKVTYPSKEELSRMEVEARELSKQKKREKDEKWNKRRKIEKKD